MVKEYYIILMGIFTKEILNMVKKQGKEYFNGKMVKYIKVDGIKVNCNFINN